MSGREREREREEAGAGITIQSILTRNGNTISAGKGAKKSEDRRGGGFKFKANQFHFFSLKALPFIGNVFWNIPFPTHYILTFPFKLN